MSTAAYISMIGLWIVVLWQTAMLLGLTRAVYRITETGVAAGPPEPSESEGLVGEELPVFSAVSLEGERLDNTVMADKDWAALFVSPDCASCLITLEELDALLVRTDHNVIVFCRGGEDLCRELAKTYEVSAPFVVDDDYEYSRLFQIGGAPTAVLVGPDGFVEGYGRPAGKDLEEVLEARDPKLRANNAA